MKVKSDGQAGSLDRVKAILSGQEIQVVNVGLERFAQTMESAGVKIVHVKWRPPAAGDRELARMLAALTRKDS